MELKPHQKEAVERLGGASISARLIGDEMRVGKTPTAIAIDQRLRNEVQRKQRGNNCTLIVCPKSVIDHWVDLLGRMGVEAGSIYKIDLPSKQALKRLLGSIAAGKRSANAPVCYVVINWDAVQTVKRELISAGPWFHVVGDEIHRIKGRSTKRTESFKQIKTKQKTGLSGTPADNRPEDLWSILHWLRPSEYGSYWQFLDRYCIVEEDRRGYKKIVGVRQENLGELRERMKPFYIRRTLAEVAKDVPHKQYRTVMVEMGTRQRREYDELAREAIVELRGGDVMAPQAITKLVRLQQMAIGCCVVEDDGDVHITDKPSSPKIDAVMEIVQEEAELGPFIIFAQHRDTVRLCAERLRSKGGKVATLSGATEAAERHRAVASFQDGSCDYFIGTIGACKEGITLSRANTIVRLDRSWNPSANRQLEARADSIEGSGVVTVIDIEAADSIDQDRRLKIEAKGRDTDAITSTRGN